MLTPRIAPATSRVAIISGHPNPDGQRYGHALVNAYAEGATEGGHEARIIDIARIEIPTLRHAADWRAPPAAPDILAAQEAIAWANHLVVVYPLWLGDMPALLKSFFEQISAGGFVMDHRPDGAWERGLKGKSARVIVTMGMPALVYRWFFFAHSLHSLERNILKFAGADPVVSSVIGSVEAKDGAKARAEWLVTARELGRTAT